ncbi:glycoside hydrolase family 38 C-terminal domain-containing protein [Nonomuraea salmonea]
MHDDRTLVEARLKRVLTERIRPAVYPESVPLEVGVWHAPGEPVPVAEGLAAPREPIAVGTPWGAAVGHELVHRERHRPHGVDGQDRRSGARPRVQPGQDGLPVRRAGLPARRHPREEPQPPRQQWVRVAGPAEGGEEVRLHIEAASNPVILDYHPFLPTQLGDKETAGTEPLYRLARMDLAVFDKTVWDLVMDLEVLGELMQELPVEGARRWEILRAIERALDAVDLQDVNGTAAAARAELTGVLAAPAVPSAHRISAVGHAHIDSAWLWPLRETVRKVARTASNMTTLLEEDPDFVFAMSQAQQWAWLKEHRPEVWAKVVKAVATGRFVPAGGMWVESDTNMPGSEAMARQFVHGKRFFIDEFGVDNEEVWLPDTFGFAAGLPQIIKAAGSKRLLTQKISWSQTNTFPHHTFLWEGIDGTRIFTHFPPIDTYNASLRGGELAHAARNFKDKGVARHSLAPTGHGDGGGGTTREMVARAARVRDLEGSPTVTWETPAEFFDKAEAEYPNPPVWVGELYLELHRATLTSQAKTKQGNRRSEALLREAELWAATAAVRAGGRLSVRGARPAVEDGAAAPVPRHPARLVDRVGAPGGAQDVRAGDRGAERHHRRRAARAGGRAGRRHAGLQRRTARPQRRARGRRRPETPAAAVQAAPRPAGGFVLDDGLLRVEIDGRGLVVSAYDLRAGRETVAPGRAACLPQLHPDFPNKWDAWDVDEFYRNTVTDLTEADDVRLDGVTVVVERSFGASSMVQRLTLAEGRLEIDTEVDWHETEKFLKLAFPLDVRADRYASESQYGHTFRPTHTNTSWGGRQVRGLQPPLRAPGGARLGRGHGDRLDLRPRRHPRRGRARHHDHAARLAAARAALPRPRDRPGRAPLPPRARAGRGDRRRRARGPLHQPARAPRARLRAGRAAGHGGRRRRGGDGGEAGRRRQRRRGGPLPRVARRPGPRQAASRLPRRGGRHDRPAGAADGRARAARRRDRRGAAPVRAGHAAHEAGLSPHRPGPDARTRAPGPGRAPDHRAGLSR